MQKVMTTNIAETTAIPMAGASCFAQNKKIAIIRNETAATEQLAT